MPNQAPVMPELPTKELIPQEMSPVQADELAEERFEREQPTFLEKEEAAPVSPVSERAPIPSPTAQAVQSTIKSPDLLHVEKILEEGLGPLYASLPESAKPKFKQKGEQAANEITGMMVTFRVKVKRVLELIRDWLLVIPNVNKFFLEQEAKIKTDKIIELIEAKREELANRT